MNVTMELVELQTFVISKGESIIGNQGYKQTSEVLDILAKVWDASNEDEKRYLEKLISKTPYNMEDKINS